MEMTKEQLDLLKKNHGEIFEIKIKEYSCYLRRPTRDEYFAFFSFSTTNPMKGLELILNSCWIDGDNEIMEDDRCFFGALTKCGDLVEVYEADLKKN